VHAEDAESVLTRLMQLCGEAQETANIPEKNAEGHRCGSVSTRRISSNGGATRWFISTHRHRNASN